MISRALNCSRELPYWLGLSVSLLVQAGTPVVPGDGFVGRSRIAGSVGLAATANVGATREPGEPLHAGIVGGQSVWWQWDAPSDGELWITTDGSDLDTVLAVYTGSDLRNLTEVVSNDDHGLHITSRVRVFAKKGASYAIAVDSMGSETRFAVGSISLRWSFLAEPILRPINDRFLGRIRLAGSPSGLRIETTNQYATRDLGEPYHADVVGDSSLWWEWTPQTSGPVQLSTEGSDFDTVLAVYTGDSLASLVPVAVSDDVDSSSGVLTSLLTWSPQVGRRYLIAVDGFDGASGKVSLSLAPWAPRAQNLQLTTEGVFQFRVPGLLQTTQTLESSTDPGCCWSPVPQWQVGGGIGTYMEWMPDGASRRFYRVVSLP